MWCYAFWGFGIRPGDSVFFAFSYGTFVGFWGAHYAAEKIGCLVLPGGNMTTEARVRQIMATGHDRRVLHADLRAADGAGGPGRSASTSPTARSQRVLLSGEPAGSIPATKQLIEEQWGAKAADTAGMTEVGTIIMFECDHQPGGAHIIEDHFLEEVIDPETDEPVAYGEEGERIVTSFGRGFVPGPALPHARPRLQRARVHLQLRADLRHLRRRHPRARRRHEGRPRDEHLPARDRGDRPAARRHRRVPDPPLHRRRPSATRSRCSSSARTRRRRAIRSSPSSSRELAEAHEGLRIDVRLAERESLPRFELKAKRLVDERTVWGSKGDRKVM